MLEQSKKSALYLQCVCVCVCVCVCIHGFVLWENNDFSFPKTVKEDYVF